MITSYSWRHGIRWLTSGAKSPQLTPLSFSGMMKKTKAHQWLWNQRPYVQTPLILNSYATWGKLPTLREDQ